LTGHNRLTRGLTPLYTHGQDLKAIERGYESAVKAAGQAQIEILSPTVEAFHDHKEFGRLPLDDGTGNKKLTPDVNWGWGIPESHLGYRSTELKKESGISVQDANLLKIRVTYHAPLIMPFIDRLLARFDRNNEGHGSVVGSPKGGQGVFANQSGSDPIPDINHSHLPTFPLTAEATFRMQTPFTNVQALQKVANLQTPKPGGNEDYTPPERPDLDPLQDYAPPADSEEQQPEEPEKPKAEDIMSCKAGPGSTAGSTPTASGAK